MRGRGASVFLGYALLGQAAAVASLPLLTRFLGPGDFGQLQAWLAWVSLAAAVVHLRLDLRVQQVAAAADADATLWQAAVVAIPGSLGFSLLANLAVWSDLELFRLVFSFLAIWGTAMAPVCIGRRLRDASRHHAGLINVQSTGGTAVLQTVGGRLGGLDGGMIGTAFGRALAASIGLLLARPKRVISSFAMSTLLQVVRGQLPYVGTTLLAQASLTAPLVVLPLVMVPDEFGRFSVAWRVSALPMAVVGAGLGQYWIAVATRALRGEGTVRLEPQFRRLVGVLAVIGLIVIVPGMGAAGLLSELVFGEDWGGVQGYLLLLVPVALSQFIVGPLGQSLLIAGRVSEGAVLDAGRLLSLCLIFLVSLGMNLSPLTTAGLVSAVVSSHYVVLLVRVRAAVRNLSS